MGMKLRHRQQWYYAVMSFLFSSRNESEVTVEKGLLELRGMKIVSVRHEGGNAPISRVFICRL